MNQTEIEHLKRITDLCVDRREIIEQQAARIATLEAENAQLIRHRNRLRRALQNCAALSPAASDEKHKALLETDPKNHENPQENP